LILCLSHLPVACRNDDDSSIHICSSSDHVLNVISMPRTVNMCVMSCFSLVLDVRGRNGNATLSFFGGFVDRGIVEKICETFLRLPLRDRGG
jgi:hypothetical protein